MANQLKKSKPTSAGRRFRSWVSREGLHKGSGFQGLLESKKQNSGKLTKSAEIFYFLDFGKSYFLYFKYFSRIIE